MPPCAPELPGTGGWCWWLGSRASARPGWPRRWRGRLRYRASRGRGVAATRGGGDRPCARVCRSHARCRPAPPELAPGLDPPPVGELAAARFRLYQAVTGLLRRLAEARPALVVVDDL